MVFMTKKLGKKPARLGAVKFKLSSYADLSTLPTPPAEFGHAAALSDWQVLGNDNYGDCVWAGAGHETMLWRKLAKLWYGFDDKSVLSDYSAATGFNPADPNTDQGTDMQQAAEYRRTVGIVDSLGWRHRIVAYMALDISNVQEVYTAMYLFDAVGLGIRFPASAMDQFDAGQPWSVVAGSPIEGGHYVPAISKQNGMLGVVTWGKLQLMEEAFLIANCDEAIVYLTVENLLMGKTREGFALPDLLSDLGKLNPHPSVQMNLAGRPNPEHCDLAKSISGLAQTIDALARTISKPKVFVLGFGPDEPIK